MASPDGIKSFLKKAAEIKGIEYTEDDANSLIRSYDYDYGKLVSELGKSTGISDEGLEDFKKSAYEKFKIVDLEENYRQELLLKDTPLETDEQDGYKKYGYLKNQYNYSKYLMAELDKKKPKSIRERESMTTFSYEGVPVPVQIDSLPNEVDEVSYNTRKSDLKTRIKTLAPMIDKQAQENVKTLGYVSEEAMFYRKEKERLDAEIANLEEQIKKSATPQIVGDQMVRVPDNRLNAELRTLKNIRSQVKKIYIALEAPAGSSVKSQLSGLVNGLFNSAPMEDFVTLGFNEAGRNLDIISSAKDYQRELAYIYTSTEHSGQRADGTKKGIGWLGEIKLPNGDVATEYSIGVELDGQEFEIPTLIPTLSEEEISLMVSDIIPNGKTIPESIIQKAIAHANERISQGLSPFISNEEAAFNALKPEDAALLKTYQMMNAIQSENPGNFFYKVGEGVQEMLPFIIEFAATGGVGAGAKKVAMKGTDALMKAMVKKYATRETTTLAAKMAGGAAKVATQALVMPSTIKGTIEKQLPGINEEGNLEDGMDATKAFFNTWLEMMAEVAGEDIADIAKISFRNSTIKSLAKNPGKAKEIYLKTMNFLASDAGIPSVQGMPFELLGEQITGALQAIQNDDYSFYTPEQQLHLLAVVAIAGGASSIMTVPQRIQTKKSFQEASKKLEDNPDQRFTEAVKNIALNYEDANDGMKAYLEMQRNFRGTLTQEQYKNGLDYLYKAYRYNQISVTRAAEIQRGIAEFGDNSGNLSTASVDGETLYIRNPEDAYDPQRPETYNNILYARTADGTVKPIQAGRIGAITTQSQEDVAAVTEQDMKIREEKYIAGEQAKKDAATKKVTPGREVNTPDGKATVSNINENGITVTNDKGESSIFTLDQVEPILTQKEQEQAKIEKEALLKGIAPEATVLQDQSEDITAGRTLRVVDFSNGQSKIFVDGKETIVNSEQDKENVLQEIYSQEIQTLSLELQNKINDLNQAREEELASLPNDKPIEKSLKEKEINRKYDAMIEEIEAIEKKPKQKSMDEMTADERFEVLRDTDPVLAKEMILDDIKELQDKAKELREMPNASKDAKVENLKQARVFEKEAARLTTVLAENEDYLLTSQAMQLYGDFQMEMESAQAKRLQPWEEDFLYSKVNQASFEEHSDKNYITRGLAQAWFTNGEDRGRRAGNLDMVAQELSEIHGMEITEEMLVEFMLKYQNKSPRQTTDKQNEIRREYKELTGESIDNHYAWLESKGISRTQQPSVDEEPVPFKAGSQTTQTQPTGEESKPVSPGRQKVSEILKEGDKEVVYHRITEKASQDLRERMNALKALIDIAPELAIHVSIVNSSEIPTNVQIEEYDRFIENDYPGLKTKFRQAFSAMSQQEIDAIINANLPELAGKKLNSIEKGLIAKSFMLELQKKGELENLQTMLQAGNFSTEEWSSVGMRIGNPAFIHEETVYVISDRITSVSEMKKNIIHEVAGHLGFRRLFVKKDGADIAGTHYNSYKSFLTAFDSMSENEREAISRQVFGDKFDQYFSDGQVSEEGRDILKQNFAQSANVGGKNYRNFTELMMDIYESMSKADRLRLAQLYFPSHWSNYFDEKGNQLTELSTYMKSYLADEYLAEKSESEEKLNWIQKIAQLIRKAFGFTSKQFSNSDVINILNDHRDLIRNGLIVPETGALIDPEDVRFKAEQLPETILIDGVERPTTNSNGKPIHSTEEGISNFYKWFGNSKVVDEQGRPLVVYHGTASDFDVFKNNGTNFEQSTLGYYFTSGAIADTSKGIYYGSTASEYAQNAQRSGYSELDGANIIPAYLKIEKPIKINADGWYSSNTAVDKQRSEIENIKSRRKNDGVISEYSNKKEGGNEQILVVFSPNQIKSATGNDGSFSEDTDDIRFKILGEIGAKRLDEAEEATTRLDNLNVAREMETSGKDVKVIRLATGWEKGADNKWRYEVQDIQLNTTFEDVVKNYLKGVNEVSLTEVVNDNELFTAYPKLKETKVIFDEKRPFNAKGGYANPEENIIGIGLTSPQDAIYGHGGIGGNRPIFAYNGDSFKSVLLHEIQHHIQQIEGFERGGNPEAVLQRAIDNGIRNLEERVGKENVSESDRERVKSEVQNKYKTNRRAYLSLAGEVESRNVQDRINMSPEERLNTLLSSTEDLSREDQIFFSRFKVLGETGAKRLDESQEVTHRIDNLSTAKNMAASKIDAKTIKLATGWEIGADGKWKYERPDIKRVPVEERIKVAEKLNSNKSVDLVEYIDDKELFTAYPGLRWVKVAFDKSTNAHGAFNILKGDGFGQITINPDKHRDDKDILKSVAHEIQHAIQRIEGFAEGGNTNDIALRGHLYKAGVRNTKELQEKIKELKSTFKQLYNEWERKAFGKRYKGQKAETDKLRKEWFALEKQIEDLQNPTYNYEEAYKMYISLAGEVEARNVEARMEMSDTERLNTLLSETEDVSREDQIILIKGILGKSPNDIRFKSQEVFYSPTERAVNSLKQDKGTVAQLKAMLLASGAKEAELDWMGFSEAFQNINGKITKQDLQEWVAQNKVVIDEVQKGELNSDTRYSEYVIPGGENYKEILLLMPFGKDGWEQYKNNAEGKTFKSGHWDEPNILAHIRMNERTILSKKADEFNRDYEKWVNDGKKGNKPIMAQYDRDTKVLFIEEIQSDWAQEGKKKGFAKPRWTPREEARVRELEKPRSYSNPLSTEEQAEYVELMDKKEQSGIPDMPFKQTDQWVNLSVRRILRYAAENGFDRIAWTNGEMQAERYDLSKQIGKINAIKNNDGTYHLGIFDKSNNYISQRWNVQENSLEDFVGKEMAQKISAIETGGSKQFSGLDLKVGGEGMKAFYDNIVPKAFNKIGKKFGAFAEPIEVENQKVLSIPVTESMGESVLNEGVPMFKVAKSKQEIIDFIEDSVIKQDGYHGTNSIFTDFDKSKIGSATDRGYYGTGFYFTFNSDPSWQRMAKGEAGSYGNNVMTVKLRTTNPFDFSKLSRYKGADIGIMGDESFVFLKNIAEQFPELSDKIMINKIGEYNPKDESYQLTQIPISVLPELFKKYEDDIEFEYVDDRVYQRKYTNAHLKSKVKTVTFTNAKGEERSYEDSDSLATLGFLTESQGDKYPHSEDEMMSHFIIKAIEKYDGIRIDFHPEGFMTRHPEITEAIKAKGHDSIVQSMNGDEIVVFEPEQILITDHPSESSVRFKAVSGSNNLIAIHNIKPSGIINAAKIGGLPMPSLAIIPAEQGFDDFGDISLIANKDFIDPKTNKQSKVFGSDVYSARYPSITYEIPIKSKRVIDDRMSNLPNEIQSNISLNINNDIESRGVDRLKSSQHAKLFFLLDTGKDFSPIKNKSNLSAKTLSTFSKNGWDRLEYFELSDKPEIRKAISDLYWEEYPAEDAKIQRMLSEDGYLNSNLLRNFMANAKRELRDNNKIDISSSAYAASKYIDDNGLQEEYADFINSFYNSLNISEKIFKGYSPTGYRKYIPHTLENVLKEMRKDGIRGGEKTSHGAGSVRAMVTPEFKSISEVKMNQHLLQQNIDDIKDQANTDLIEILDILKPFYKYDSSSFGYYDNASEELVRLSTRGQSESFKPLDDESRQSVKDYLDKLRNLPTEYFEAKINRGVSIAEFAYALVPEDTQKDVLDILSFNGVETIKYSNEEDRKTKLNELAEKDENIRFKAKIPEKSYNLDEKNVYNFILDLQEAFGRQGAYADYKIINNNTLLRIKDHSPNWVNFAQDLENNPDLLRVINVTVGNYNDSDNKRNKWSIEELEERYPDIEFMDYPVEDGSDLINSIELISTLINKPVQDDTRFKVQEARKQVDPSPSEAQKAAGNYQKGHIRINGFDISIENPKGSMRSGVDKDGNEWSQEMKADYGYIKGTVGKDKDHIDVFLGDNLDSGKIYVIDQIDPGTKKFDEHKIMMGFDNMNQARKAYLGSYEKGWQGLRDITSVTVDELKNWIEKGSTKKPFTESGIRFKVESSDEKTRKMMEDFYALRSAAETAAKKKLKVRESAKESEMTIDPDLVESMEYNQLSNKSTVESVREYVDKHGVDRSMLEYFDGTFKSDGAFQNAIGIELYRLMNNQGNLVDAFKILDKLAVDGKRAGQEVQYLSVLKRMTPEGQLKYIKSQVDKINEDIRKHNRKNTNNQKPLIDISEEEWAEVAKELNDVFDIIDLQTLKDFIIRNSGVKGVNKMRATKLINGLDLELEWLRNRAVATILNKVYRKVPESIGMKISTYQAISHLLNPKTFLRNIISNRTMRSAERMSRRLGGAIDLMLHKIMTGELVIGKATHFIQRKEIKADAKIKGKETTLDILIEVNKQLSQMDKYRDIATQWSIPSLEEARGKTNTFQSQLFGALEKALTESLVVPDEISKQKVRAEYLAEYENRTGLKPDEEIMEEAEEMASYMTFQNDSWLSTHLTALKKLLNGIGITNFGMGDLLIKYTRVPGNIITRTFEYSPLGAAKALVGIGKVALSKEKTREQQIKAIMGLSRGLTGTAIMTLGYVLAKAGLGIGDDDDNDEIKKLSAEAGLSGDKLNISAMIRFASGEDTELQGNDILINYDWLQPVGSLMKAGSQIARSENFGQSTLEIAVGFSELPSFMIINKMISEGMYSDADNIAEKAYDVITVPLVEGAGGFVPSPIRQIANITDKTARDTYYSGEDKLTQAGVKVVANIPGLRTVLPARVRPTGEEKVFSTDNALLDIISTFGPGTLVKYEPFVDTKILNEISKYKSDEGTSYVPLRYAPKTIIVEGERYKLTKEEQGFYMRAYGQELLYDYIPEAQSILISDIDAETADEYAKSLSTYNKQAKDAAKEAVVDNFNRFWDAE